MAAHLISLFFLSFPFPLSRMPFFFFLESGEVGQGSPASWVVFGNVVPSHARSVPLWSAGRRTALTGCVHCFLDFLSFLILIRDGFALCSILRFRDIWLDFVCGCQSSARSRELTVTPILLGPEREVRGGSAWGAR